MIVEAVIEDPRGATRRHVRDRQTGEWIEKRHPHAVSPWPANYGFLAGTYNAADGDELDVLVLSTSRLATGTVVPVRPVGVLLRPDGDHKIIAVLLGDPAYQDIRWLGEVPPGDIMGIDAWFAEWTTVKGYRDAGSAEELIAASRR